MKPDTRKEREIALYEAALRLIASGVNPAAMKVQQIADEAGIGKGTVYEYFSSKEEILRRFYAEQCRHRRGRTDGPAVYKIELLLKQLGLSPLSRSVVAPALAVAERTGDPAAAMEMPDGKILTGKTSELLGCSSALLLNALKYLGGIPDEVQLISPSVIEPVQDLKVNVLGNKNPRLHIDELLVALSICAVTDPNAKRAVQQLQKLRGCEAHTTVILSEADEDSFRRLGVRLTSEPKYQTSKLYHG